MKTACLFTLLLTAALSVSAQNNFDTVQIQPVKITDAIYMLKGAGGNIGLLVGKEGSLLIDDQYAPLSNKINGAVKTIDPGEIRFLINTHIHGDHTGGNENFKKMGVILVAQDQVRERMMKESVNTSTNTTSPPRDKEAWPLITFADKLNFHINDEDIILYHFDRGHTDGDVIIQFKKANIVHTGDAFVRYGYPYIDVNSGGSVNGFINTLNGILEIMDDNTIVIPGHGELASKADVKKLRDQMTDIRDQVLKALKSGRKVEDISDMGITDKYDTELGKGFLKGADFVLMIAENLKKEK